MATACSRCGRVGEVDYGADGLPYCSSCVFYGMNRQCFRCRMYVPASELQQYKGVWACPYCIQNMRDEDRKASAPAERPHVPAVSYSEACERCGRALGDRVYIWNNRRLCKTCLEEEQASWGVVGGGPGRSGVRISVVPAKKARQRSLIEAAIGNLLALLGMKKKEPEIVVVEPMASIAHAKPMAERRMAKEKPGPQSEGIMTGKALESGASKPPAPQPGRKGAPAGRKPGRKPDKKQ
jgi:hypothetical protein